MNDKLLKNVYEEIDKLKPIILYGGSSSHGPISLSDSVANYSCIEIFYHSADNNYQSTGKIYNANNKSVSLFAAYNINDVIYNKQAIINISGSSITISNEKEISLWAGNQSINTGTYFYIDKVIGYK